MKAKLKKKTSREYRESIEGLEGFYEFEEACINKDGTKMFAPIDKNWPSSAPIKESDLEFEK